MKYMAVFTNDKSATTIVNTIIKYFLVKFFIQAHHLLLPGKHAGQPNL